MSKDTYLSLKQRPFPKPNPKINTEEFLSACRDFIALLDTMGKVFAPASYDMNGNIEKLSNVYEKNCDNNKYLEDMILQEKLERDMYATDALMWLRRALTFILEFFEGLCSDTMEETNVLIKRAYGNTLKQYHGWFSSNLFNILTRIVPQRTVLIKQLAFGKEDYEDFVLSDMQEFTLNLRLCVTHLEAFYKENDLEIVAQV